MSDTGYNIGEGSEGYLEGASKFKPIKVELRLSNVKKTEEVDYWVNEITNQYADFVITNVKADPNKVTFDMGSPSMEDLTAKDIEFRLKEYLQMNVPPFEVKEIKVQQ
ncbi:MAG TPA: hypothetical protein VE622_03185 [Nitrososphaeraceae archaeon]|nr:hypothetical protein [Nitrososphaeraceae archaeon]